MIVSEHLVCPLAIHSTDFGIDRGRRGGPHRRGQRHRLAPLPHPDPRLEDLEKIRLPRVTHDAGSHRASATAPCATVYDDILPVRKIGQTHIWFTPWDYLIRWWGVEEAMMDLVQRPDLVHAGVRSHGRRLDGGAGPVRGPEPALARLPTTPASARAATATRRRCRASPSTRTTSGRTNMWGCSNAQIFSDVSPQMHWEFALEHDMRWLDALGHDLLRLLRAAGQVHRRDPAHPQPAQDLDDAVGG